MFTPPFIGWREVPDTRAPPSASARAAKARAE